MLSPNESPAAFSMLAGIAVLVLVGVGFSLLVDRRFELSSGARQMRGDVAADEETIERLADRLRLDTKDLEAQTTRRNRDNYDSLVAQLAELESAANGMTELVTELEEEIETIDKNFTDYRAEYRRKTWAAAEGEKIGSIRLRGGREYQEVILRKVTPAGLEIEHGEGLARIQVPDLDEKFQDRFQWDAEERHALLERERENRNRLAQRLEATPQAVRPEGGARPASTASTDVENLRFRVRAWRAKVNVLQAQATEAAANATWGSRVSAPGSLETWQARAGRLRGELEKARLELRLAGARLADVSPGDSVLVELLREQE